MIQYQKYSADVLDYEMDWSSWLRAGDTIVSSSFSVSPSGVTMASNTFTTTRATVWLSGGTARQSYIVYNTIVTGSGRTATREFQLYIKPVV